MQQLRVMAKLVQDGSATGPVSAAFNSGGLAQNFQSQKVARQKQHAVQKNSTAAGGARQRSELSVI